MGLGMSINCQYCTLLGIISSISSRSTVMFIFNKQEWASTVWQEYSFCFLRFNKGWIVVLYKITALQVASKAF